jgi:demethylmenaquinone methyltransferase / 2-methoxy-6-polyprenyl-1,4-benzoquinol methylase
METDVERVMLTGVTPQWLRWMFGRIARRYDLTNTIISAGLDRHWRWRLAQRVVRAPVHDLLDVACGTAGVMLHVARLCAPATRLIGVDFTEAMLHVGQRRLRRVASRRSVSLCAADALCLPYADASFDVVTMVFGVRNFADPCAGLAECYRVLQAGGRLCVVEFAWPQHPLLRALYNVYWRYVLPLIAWPLAGERSAYRYLRDSVLAFRQQPNLVVLLRQAGFIDIYSEPLSGGIAALYEGRKPSTEEVYDDRLAYDPS